MPTGTCGWTRPPLTLNGAGQIIAETRFDGQTRRYQRDTAGQVLTQWVGEQATQFAYDPTGRVAATTYPDGSQEQFTYRSDGSLLEARNDQLTVTWERNSLGQVLLETQGEHIVSSTYDLAGQRIALQSEQPHDENRTPNSRRGGSF